jgi:hypothetical protein
MLQISAVVGGSAIVGAVFWGMVLTAISQKIFEMSEVESMALVFLPSSILILVYLLISLPSPLRKAGMLSDDPSKFGPWFKD